MATAAPPASVDEAADFEGDATSTATASEYAAYESKLQEAVASVFTLPGSFGIHGSARQVIDQLDELCLDEVCLSPCPHGRAVLITDSFFELHSGGVNGLVC